MTRHSHSLRIITADLGGRIYWTWTWGEDPGVAYTPWEGIQAMQQLQRRALPGQAEPEDAPEFNLTELPSRLLKLSGLTADGELSSGTEPDDSTETGDAVDAARIGQATEGRRAQVRMAHRCLTGPLSSREEAESWARDLADILLPPTLVAEIVERATGESRIDLAIMPSALCNAVPWEILPIDSTRVLLDVADIVSYAPITQRELDGHTPNLWTDDHTKPALRVIDPDSDGEGRSFVLDQKDRDTWRTQTTGQAFTRVGQHYDRLQLSRDLRGPGPARPTAERQPGELTRPLASRFFYVGHVTAPSNDAKSTSLMLGCEARTYGTTGMSGRVRGFSASDANVGTLNYREEILKRANARKQPPDWDQHYPEGAWTKPNASEAPELMEVAGTDLWPMPSRVALIACHSGADFGHAEPFGLVTAFFEAGAELITATRWTIITDRVFDCYTTESRHPVQEAALTVDAAHTTADPVDALARWQRERLAAWRSGGHLADSPLTWAAFTTYRWQPRVTALPPDLQALFDERPDA